MITILNVMMIFAFIHSCILKKKQYCAELKLLEERPDHEDKLTGVSEKTVQNGQLTNNPSSVNNEQYNCESKRLKLCLPVHNNTTTQSFLNDNFFTEPFESQDFSKKYENEQTDIDSSSKNSDDKKEPFDVNIDKIYSDVVNHISKSQDEIDLNPYLHKFANIYITYKFLENNECNKKKYNSFFEPFEQNFLKSLNVALLKFNNLEAKFSEKDCDTFINNLDKSINSDTKLNKLQKKLKSIEVDDKKLLFYSEFTKCIKYFIDIPELMTLGRIFACKSIDNQIISIHLIYLLLKEQKNISSNKIFVLFLIKKVFSSSKRNNLNLFSIQMLPICCLEDQNKLHLNNFHFFLWEINNEKRNQLKKKLKGLNVFKWSSVEVTHFRSIILLFLFQQIMLMRFSNADYSSFEGFFELINSVIGEKNKCPICFFNKYIEVIKQNTVTEYNK